MCASMPIFFSLILLAASASAFINQDADPEGFLVGGTATGFGDFPAVARIVTPDREICGAAVIDAHHVVTLAQCVLNASFHLLNPRLVRVHTGEIRLNPVYHTRQSSLAAIIYVHQNFKAHTLENDIAVIRVRDPFHLPSNEVEPAFRRTRIVGNGEICHTVSWGMVSATVLDLQQRYIPVTINNRDTCNNIRRGQQVFESMICAGNMDGVQAGPSLCAGSLGSGMYCAGDLVGLLSFGLNCGAPNNPPTFTQIRFFNPWIQQQLMRNDVPPAGWSPLDV